MFFLYIANANVYVSPQKHYYSAWIFAGTEQLKLYFFIKRSTVYRSFARFRILAVAVSLCNARFGPGINQSDGELVIGNACSLFVSGSWSSSDKNMFLDVVIVVKKLICWGLDQSAAPRESTVFWPLWWRIFLSSEQTTLSRIRSFNLHIIPAPSFKGSNNSSNLPHYLFHTACELYCGSQLSYKKVCLGLPTHENSIFDFMWAGP